MPETKNKVTTMDNHPGMHTIWWYVIAVLVLIADQVTKSAVVAEFYLGQRDIVSSFFNLVYVRNYGAAFSFLSDAGGWQRLVFRHSIYCGQCGYRGVDFSITKS